MASLRFLLRCSCSTLTCAWVAGRQRSMIFIRWGSQQFGENGFQSVRPYLVSFDAQVKLISIEHALEQLAGFVCKLVVYIQIPDLFAVGKFRDIFVNLIDDGHYRRVVIAGSDAHQDDGSIGSLFIA